MRTLTALFLLLSFTLSAQVTTTVNTAPFIFGEALTFHSKILDQERVLNVHLPDGYADSTLSYPVIYVLDGSANEDFPHIAGLAQFMNMYDLLPQSIVVGIANNGRSRYHDFTGPTQSDSDKVWVPTYGGAADFIGYLEKEVEPMVKEHYRTSGHRTLIGQSLGGLLGMEVLFTKPELFDDYILVSPSLWWNNGALAAKADAWVKQHATSPKRVFIAYAPDDAMMQAQIDHVVKSIRENAKAPFEFWKEPFPEESHATILHRAVYKAFEDFYPQPKK
ncbi:MAG: alpha/beta hydrolase [Flavobacteriales bacterium]|nr:alpha/beta hydrolase [Flavobacteriales bacterium]